MCGVLGIVGTPVETDEAGRMDLGGLDRVLAGGRVGTAVATAGTTGLGAIDPVHEVLAIARSHGVRVHVDAAYGGFFILLAGLEDRAGAAAAALWLTFRLLPPTPDGLGRVLAAGRRAALDWAELISDSERLDLYQRPELDIVSYFPATLPRSLSAIDEASARMLAKGMADGSHPAYLSTLRVAAGDLARRHPGVEPDRDGARILRSVVMKPEAESYVRELHTRVEQLAYLEHAP